jgi:glycosyltransferase involved in cell wall biosynthesis
MKVSVVLCTFNRAGFLKAAVESVLSQTYRDFELIVIDDHSDDATPRVLAEIFDSRVFVIRNPENLGIAKSRNIALKRSVGELLAVIDSDDIWEPAKLEKQLRVFMENPSVVGVGSNAYEINEVGEVIGTRSYPATHDEIVSQYLWSSPFLHSTFVFKKIKGLLYDESLRQAEDLKLFIQLSGEGQLLNVDEPLARYRLHSENITQVKNSEQITDATRVRLDYLAELLLLSAEDCQVYSLLVGHDYDGLVDKQRDVNIFFLKLSKALPCSKILVVRHTWILHRSLKKGHIDLATCLMNIRLRLRLIFNSMRRGISQL